MEKVSIIGLDLAKSIIQVHAATAGPCPHKKRVSRNNSKYLLFMDGH